MKEKGRNLQIALIPIDLKNSRELKWLHSFIHSYHSAPKFILPSKDELKNPSHHFFRAFEKTRGRIDQSQMIGITSYEVRTRFLAETQRTIISPNFRGQGWGKAVSIAIENQVKKDGFYKVRSCIYHDNIAMIQIKLAQGYIIEGFHPDHDGPGLHEYSLGKKLVGRR